MKNLLIILIFIVCEYGVYAQNLIRNSNFDIKTACPNSNSSSRPSEICPPWKDNGLSTICDYCILLNTAPYHLISSIPINYAGNQTVLSDSSYLVIYALSGAENDIRGLVYQKLENPLLFRKKYWIEYYTSLSDSSNYAVKAMGATFTMDTLTIENLQTPIFDRPFKMENIESHLTDKINWTRLQWIFEADSTYQTFLIGYAKNIQNLDTLFVGSDCYWCTWANPNRFSFYYIENVGVYPIISNNQTLQPCTFPQLLQGPVDNEIWFREWKKDTTVLSANINQTINQAGTYTLTWRTDTTVHIDTFWVEASVPIANFLGQDMAWQSGNSITLTAPDGYSYLWNTGSNTQNIVVDTTGIFSVVVTNSFDCAYTDSLVVFNPLGLEEVIEKLEVEIYPNPAKENINIKSTEPNCNIDIYTSDGKMVLHQKLVNSLTINVAEWQQGIYFVKFYSERGTKIPMVRKVVIQK